MDKGRPMSWRPWTSPMTIRARHYGIWVGLGHFQGARRVPCALRFLGHPAVAYAVEEIDDEAEQQPDAKPEPRVAWQSEHEQHRRQRSRWRHEIDRRRPEGTLDVWLRDAQRKHAETDNGEGKQRADAHQLTDSPIGSSAARIETMMPTVMVLT